VLTDVAVSFELDGIRAEDGPPVNRVYPKGNFDLFEGQQLVVVGRYRKPGAAKVVIKGRVGMNEQKLDFPATLVEKSGDESYAFVEKLWAMRRIGEIIDQLDLAGRNEELVRELVDLSTRHGILTPYTSFLADETLRPLADAGAVRRATESLSELDRADGLRGVAQRAEKGRFQNATNGAPAAAKEFYLSAQPGGASATGGAAGLGGGVPGPQLSTNSFRDLKTDREVAAESVRQYGNQAVYARKRMSGDKAADPASGKDSQQIVVTPETAELDLEKDKDKIEVVDRFSEGYFAIVKANTLAENQILSQQRSDEQLLIRLRGKNYLVR
jgi:Ca-activated chloride channel family protein